MINSTWLTTEVVADMTGKSAKTVRRWIRKGVRGKTLPATFDGLNWKVCPATLQNWLREISYQQLEAPAMVKQ